MTDARIIDVLGGGTALAAAIAETTDQVVSRDAIYMWKKTGIPEAWRLSVQLVAQRKGVDLPKSFARKKKRQHGPS